MARTDRDDTGMEMANHWSQDKGGDMSPRAMRFWGDEMGDACPPMLAARAMAIYMSASKGYWQIKVKQTFPENLGGAEWPCTKRAEVWRGLLTIRAFEKTDLGCNSLVIGCECQSSPFRTELYISSISSEAREKA